MADFAELFCLKIVYLYELFLYGLPAPEDVYFHLFLGHVEQSRNLLIRLSFKIAKLYARFLL